MPLRDHFHMNSTVLNWEALHGFWPAAIVTRLNSILPKDYIAQPRVRLGRMMEIDVGALERESSGPCPGRVDAEGGVAVAAWVPAAPAILLDTEFPDPDEYEVNVYSQDEFRLVAAVELVSPSNKDRSENRQTFVNKCESRLKKDVCVTIVDPVTSRTANLYGELLDEVDAPRTAVSQSAIYAATCRGLRNGPRWRLVCWEHELAVGAALPTLPIWISPDLMVPLGLEATYEETCRSLRIP
ncbi:MAG TPA: hypothetical protein VGX76_05845 [Pirellulales bacterium]|nr:hypothetical protein [Pirellulales bacterium]